MRYDRSSYNINVIKGLPKEIWARLIQNGFKVTLLWALDHAVRIFTGAPLRRLSQITPQLYLGGQYDQRGWEQLKKWSITSVVNLRVEFDVHSKELASDQYIYLPTVEDEASTQKQLQAGVDFIQKMIDQNNSVYVHCRSGLGRSAALVAAYLINTGLTVNQAWMHIQKVRPFIRPKETQILSINQYANNFKK